jgi:hypothetical protein
MLRLFNKRAFSTSIKARFPGDYLGKRAEDSAEEKSIGDRIEAKMDGDSTAKTMDKGANSALGNNDLADGIHEASNQAVGFLPKQRVVVGEIDTSKQAPAGEKTQGTGTSAFHKDGAIGSAFKADGAIGSMGEKVGGPFASDGAIGFVHFLMKGYRINLLTH